MYLGIDLGTSSTKTLLIDADQNPIASASADYRVSRPRSGWSEQDPADWIAALRATLAELKSRHGKALAAVRGIGLSGQQHGAVLLDAADRVLRPCILWNDSRSAAEAQRLSADPTVRRQTQNIIYAGFTAPKILWLRQHEPEIAKNIARVLLPKDYLRLWLTGRHVSEPSDASGTGWLDIGRRVWSDELLALCGLERAAMPELVEGSAASGRLRPRLAAELGLSQRVTVAGGGGDNAAAACAMGVLQPGSAFVSLGTSGVLFAANDAFRPNIDGAVHAFCHAVPDVWHQMGVMLAATDSLNWLSALLGAPPARLTGALGERLRAPGGVVFLPYLGGERTPHNDAAARGALVGLEHASDAPALTQAVLEGVTFAFKDCYDALAAAGTDIERVWAMGGGSRSRYWLQALATALKIPVDVPAAGDYGGAFGAARLGLTAAEAADPQRVCTPPRRAATIQPDETLVDAFAAAQRRFRALYPACRRG